MANTLFTPTIKKIDNQEINLTTAVVRCLLVRDIGDYVVNKDHEFLSSWDGSTATEIDVTSYARQTIANYAIAADLANDRAEHDADDIAFGALESGQTANAYIFYVQIGGDDLTPADDPLLLYIDTATGLPLILDGNTVDLVVGAEGFLQAAQA